MEDTSANASEESENNSFIDPEDIHSMMEPSDSEPGTQPEQPDDVVLYRPAREILTSEADFDISDASIVVRPGGTRSSTKVRAATLGYLRGFSLDPDRLREETRRLTLNRDLQVLHLCGCGIPFHNPEGTLVPGCCEWSHLKLGTAEENGRHKSYHIVMGMTVAEDYPALCGIVHKGQDGNDLF